ncbi:NAD+ synthase [Helicobacter saguini]|nr:NAD+ synthase [Helicobacter saguini]
MKEISINEVFTMIKFLKKEVAAAGFERVIVGLSGGIDSAVVATLCHLSFCVDILSEDSMDLLEIKNAKSSKKSNLKALLMPSLTSSKESINDALKLCEKFDIEYEIADIKDFDRIYCEKYGATNKVARGNFCARMRMATLYDFSQKEKRLVIGTSNKSELMLGYGTLFGDLACALNPIGGLYKSQIFELAKFLHLPDSIIEKKPSADLYEGQSDEAEIGYTYQEIDTFLEKYCEYAKFWDNFIKQKELEIRAKKNKTREEFLAYLSKKFDVQDLNENNKKEKIIEKLLTKDFPTEMIKALAHRIKTNAFKANPTKILRKI